MSIMSLNLSRKTNILFLFLFLSSFLLVGCAESLDRDVVKYFCSVTYGEVPTNIVVYSGGFICEYDYDISEYYIWKGERIGNNRCLEE